MNGNYKICTRCVMDTTDPDIIFDDKGECNHCKAYDDRVKKEIFLDSRINSVKLDKIVFNIKDAGKNNRYDCIIGISGGVDSTFVAYKAKQLGLRPLAVHLDNGWDSELAVKNIENVLKKLGIELYTHVIDWNEFKDLQLAFLKASTPDSEIPSDHAILALLYQMADKFKIKYVLPGFNIRTESHLPRAWSQGHEDWKYIKSVHKRFGTVKLKTFPHMNFYEYNMYLLTQKWIPILNYFNYVKKDALKILENDLGWKYYGGKHYESIYTRFYQGYILPKKFGYDKRKTHFSSLICSGEMSRDDALAELKNEIYPLSLQNEDKEYVIKKLGLTDAEFNEIMKLPRKTYWDYPSYDRLYKSSLYKKVRTLYSFLKGNNSK
jgi:N-acetyl sugar amidotransferase